LTDDDLVETIRHMNKVIYENHQILRNVRSARDIAEERLRNAEIHVKFLHKEARETQGHKRPREELDP
jgi:translation initiation factor 2 beta subunit (eIF-2beta)/eIF-5